MKFLTDDMISGLLPAETASFPSPVPTQIVSSDEFPPVPQTARQHEVETRLPALSVAPAVLSDRGGHGRLIRRAQPGIRSSVRCDRGRGRDPGAGGGPRRCAVGT